MAGAPEENTTVVGHPRGANANPTTETPIPDPELVELLMTHSTAPSDVQISKHYNFPLTSVKEIIRNNSSIKSIIQEMSEGKNPYFIIILYYWLNSLSIQLYGLEL